MRLNNIKQWGEQHASELPEFLNLVDCLEHNRSIDNQAIINNAVLDNKYWFFELAALAVAFQRLDLVAQLKEEKISHCWYDLGLSEYVGGWLEAHEMLEFIQTLEMYDHHILFPVVQYVEF